MALEGISSNQGINNTEFVQNENRTPQYDWQARLKQGSIWDFANLNGYTASTAYQG